MLVRFPFLKNERPGANWTAIEAALAQAELGGVLAEFCSFFGQGGGIQQVFGQNSHGPCTNGWGVKPFVYDPQFIGIDDFDLLDRLIVGNTRRKVFGVHDGFEGELDIFGGHRAAVMEPDIRAKEEIDNRIMGSGGQDFLGQGSQPFRRQVRFGRHPGGGIEALKIVSAQHAGQAFEKS